MTPSGPPADDLDRVLGWAREPFEGLRGARLFLSGGTGFIGQWLLASLLHAEDALRLGVKVLVLTRDPEAFRRRAPALAEHPAVGLWSGDVRWFEYPKGAFTHVVHGAGDTSQEAADRPLQLLDTIVGGTRRMLELASMSGAQFLLTSSGAVYGELPAGLARVPEEFGGGPDLLDPRSAYGEAKRLAEQLCALYTRHRDVPAVIARCFAFVGPLLPLHAHFAVGNFIRDALGSQPIQVRGDGSPLRSYLYAADLSAWLVTLLVRGTPGRAYNVGSDQAVSIRELALRVADTLAPGRPVAIASEPGPAGARSRYVPSIARAREELGLEVWTDLPEALRRTGDWHRTRKPEPPGDAAATAPFTPRTFVIDVDGVVATLSPGNDYARAEPLPRTIEAVNRLYEAGHRIVMFTARGTVTGLDWRAVTERQFHDWGLRYHELVLGKPAADYYVDDRMIPVEALRDMA